jgi:hypothetical protein
MQKRYPLHQAHRSDQNHWRNHGDIHAAIGHRRDQTLVVSMISVMMHQFMQLRRSPHQAGQQNTQRHKRSDEATRGVVVVAVPEEASHGDRGTLHSLMPLCNSAVYQLRLSSTYLSQEVTRLSVLP